MVKPDLSFSLPIFTQFDGQKILEAILYYMESRGLSRQDLEPYIGSRARVSEILNRRRPLTLQMVRRLHSGLGIPAEVLIQPYGYREVEGWKVGRLEGWEK